MANNVLGILVNLTVRGREQVKGVSDDLKGLGGASQGVTSTIGKLAVGLTAATGAIVGVGFAAKQVWGVLKEGAAIDLTRQRFDNLTESIGTTSDALMSQLRAATSGMIDDMSLMSSASQIISLKLADTSDQVVRLSAVSGQLGWNMQQVILTFANMSTMRLDALGLSVEEVTSRAKELEAAGMSAQQAFKEAVIQAGEARLGTLGSEADTASGSLKAAGAAVTNLKNALLESVVATLDQAGAFDALRGAAEELSAFASFTGELDRMLKAGELTKQQYNELNAIIRRGGVEMAEATLKQMTMSNALNDTGDATKNQVGAWQTWATAVAISLASAEDNAQVAAVNIVRDLAAIRAELLAASADAEKLASAGFMRAGRARQNAISGMSSGYGGLPYASADRLQAGYLAKANMDYDRAAESAYSYGGAVSYALTQEEALAAAHARLADAFTNEVMAKPEDGLINAEGLVNVTAMNDALYQQAQNAGASAVELAMLGVATGKFTKEQAAAALKAAILQEQIRKVAEGVAGGNIKYDAAVGYLEEFRQKLDASGGGAEGATANVEELVGMAKELTEGPYQADINANTVQAQADLQAILDLINGISGVHQATIIVDDQNGHGGNQGNFALGGPVMGGRPAIVGENGPELFVPSGNGYIIPNNRLTDWQGGSSLNISITNMVEGRVIGRSQLDDITTDSLMHALRAGGVV